MTEEHPQLAALRKLIVVALLAASVVLLIAAVFLAWRVTQVPFAGLFTEPTLVINDVGNPNWPGYAAGLHAPFRLVAVDGEPLEHATSLMPALAQYEPGDLVTLTVRSPDGTQRDAGVRLIDLPFDALLDYFLVPYVVAWIYLGVGIWVLRARRDDVVAQIFGLLCVVIALSLGLLFDLYTTRRFSRVWITAISFIGSVGIHLALVFPQRMRFLDRAPVFRYLTYVPGAILAVANQFSILNFQRPWAYGLLWEVSLAFAVAGVVALLAMMIFRSRYSESPVVRSQARVILGGVLLGFGPFALWYLSYHVGTAFPTLPVALAWFIAFPISVAYAIRRYRLFNITMMISRGVAYALLSAVVVGGYFLLLSLVNRVFGVSLRASHPLVLGVFVLLLAVLLNQLWLHLRQVVDRIFLGQVVDRHELVDRFSAQLPEMMDLPAVVTALEETLSQGWDLAHAALFLYDPQRACYAPRALVGDELAQNVTFDPEGALASQMLEGEESIYLYQDRLLPPDLKPEREALAPVLPALFVPIPDHGWLTLTSARGGSAFTSESLNLFEVLGSHASMALERARLVEDLKRRVEEVDVLRWVAQAVNFTVDVDDLMELIYAQTGRVLDTSNFYIASYNAEKETLSYAFYVEDDERLYPDEEWSVEVGLTGEIIRTGRPIVTQEYMAECRRRGVTPAGEPGRAWMGVPLSAGDEIIGVMNVSSPDPAVAYSNEQLTIFSAIADQAAAILDKARLYREMEERARELAVLNEVGSVITSSLDLDTVLNRIMDKAVDLLGAEAGSLILIDQEAEELIFEVTTGAGSLDLVGTRIPLDTGIAGTVIEEGEPVIIRDAQSDQRWYRGVDESTDFVTHTLMAVPMISRGEVIGVIELLNRQDGLPFDEEDEQLLTAFAANAAVSIENARLFTQTDRALAERVQELSMMQRIDRELNATLDYDRVMDIAMDWALEMTGADIGFLAMVVESEEEGRGLRLLVNRGYPEEVLGPYREQHWPLERGVVGRVARTGEPVLVEKVDDDEDYVAAASDMVAELAVPIRREDRVIGVIGVESSEPGQLDQECLERLTRLADHAAIAIENARLFRQVRRADEAKTEFVSFVSHELKQPMTSLKGYTDLLLKGVGGEVTDAQREFLSTIRANVERMGSLVNELLDVSRIESGRIELDVTTLSMEKVIDQVVRTSQRQVEDKHQDLEVEVADGLPPARGDRDRLVQILSNLMSNAVKYTPEGGRIAVRARHITEETSDEAPNGFVRCAVVDSGIGISPEDQEKLFTKYFRADEPAVRDVPGTGLGLVITKSLVEMHGGNISVESEPGEGSTFTFTVPAAQ